MHSLTVSRELEVLSEFFPQLGNPRERLFEPRLASRHPAFVPDELPELPVEGVHGAGPARVEKPVDADANLLLGSAESIGAGRDLLSRVRGEIARQSVRKNEVAIGESLHQ